MKTYVLYVTVHFRDLRSSAPRPVTEIAPKLPVLMGEQKPYQVLFFLAGAKSYPV